MIVNGVGAIATAITTVVVLVAKFTEGAWITILLIPGLILMMRTVKRHYDRVAEETRCDRPVNMRNLQPPLVVMPVARWSRVAEKGLRFAWTLSKEIHAVHVDCGEEGSQELRRRWRELVEEPARQAGLPPPDLVVLDSPYRFVIRPILNYLLDLEARNPGRQIAVLVPEMMESRWIYNLLHNQRPSAIKALLLFKGNRRIMVINIPWYLHAKE